MKALRWYGNKDVRVETVDEPQLINDQDAIIRVTSTAICGSDLHIYNNIIPHMHKGDILGHEFMGEVVALGAKNKRLAVGDKVVVPFTISCGKCKFCKKGLFACCDSSNPNALLAKKEMGQAPAGFFGYSDMTGGFPGGQAEYVRVPFSDIGPLKIPKDIPDEKLLFLSDIFPTGYMAAENCQIQKGDTIAIWGCGPVGQFAIQSAWLLGAKRVIAIDCVAERLALAESYGKAETINFEKENVYDALMAMTKGQGPECCIDAVGCEAHVGPAMDSLVDKAKELMYLTSSRAHVLREAIQCCAKGGRISVPGVYIGTVDNFPMGAVMNKGLTIKTGQTHVPRYLETLLKLIMQEKIDPSKIITHKIKLEEAPQAYKKFNEKKDGCIKVVIRP